MMPPAVCPIYHQSMSSQGTRHQTDPSGQQRQHYQRAEQAQGLEINVEVHDNAGEDDHDTDKQEQPTDL